MVRRPCFATSSQAPFLPVPWRTQPCPQFRDGAPYLQLGFLHGTNIIVRFTTKYHSNTSIRNKFYQILPFLGGFNSFNKASVTLPVQDCYYALASYFKHLTRFKSTNRLNHIINIKEHSHLPANLH